MKTIRSVFPIVILLGLIGGNALPQQTTMTSAHYGNLLPVPSSVNFQSGRLPIMASFFAAAKGHSDARLEAGLARMSRRIEMRTGLEFSRASTADTASATLIVQCQGPGKTIPSLEEDESYSL